MSFPADFDIDAWTADNRAVVARLVGDELVAVVPMTFGKFRVTIGNDPHFIEHGY